MTRVLVTGATGFLGRHLCRHLLDLGYEVRGTRRQNVAGSGDQSIQWTTLPTIGPDTDWTAALDGVAYVIHLAHRAHQIDVHGDDARTALFRISVDGTRSLASAVASVRDLRRLILVSSIGAMRSFAERALTEESPCQPDTDYGRSKLEAEDVLRSILADTSADWCIVRPPLVYGPGNPGNMARLLRLVETGVPLPLGAIENRRSFVYIGNLIDALERCMHHPGASRQTFLVSDSTDVSTPELLRILGRVSGKAVRIFPVPLRILRGMGRLGDGLLRVTGRSYGIDTYGVDRLTHSLTVDASAIRRAIGWSPRFTLEEGLSVTLGPDGLISG
jgi:nucleoside-diphosphate-sugar epimerase